MRTVLLALVFVVLATPALATDGVLEINQTCAVQTGCFSGDTAGYPITIDGSAGRSYRLTSDLIVPDENTDGIKLSTSDIGIDLNNFTIIRSGCEGATTDCTPVSGTGSGIEYASATNRGISVKNGSITGMGNSGVLLGEQAEATGLRVRWNRLDGISANKGSTVSGNTAYQNGDEGISAGTGSTVSGNTVYGNGDEGIFASSGSTVSGNTVYQNGDSGIFVNPSSTVSGNTAYNNGDDGIVASTASTVSGNTVNLNGDDGIFANTGSTVSENTAYNNSGDGIATSSGVTVQRNNVRSNGGYGLNLGLDSAYRENLITSNTTGSVIGGVNMFSNSCNGTTTCP